MCIYFYKLMYLSSSIPILVYKNHKNFNFAYFMSLNRNVFDYILKKQCLI